MTIINHGPCWCLPAVCRRDPRDCEHAIESREGHQTFSGAPIRLWRGDETCPLLVSRTALPTDADCRYVWYDMVDRLGRDAASALLDRELRRLAKKQRKGHVRRCVRCGREEIWRGVRPPAWRRTPEGLICNRCAGKPNE